MEVEFLSKFSEDLDSVTQKSIKSKIICLIELFESSNSLSKIPQIKKLTGHRNAYRIRIGNYRLGIFVEGSKVQFARIVHRKNIYKVFP
jgi:mRNA interferase RelE/StbE